MNEIHKLNIGIIGGGQLGKMILAESNRMSLNTSVLDSNKNSPCKNLTNNFFVGDLNNYNDVLEFGKKCDIITFEIEHINVDALTELQKIGKKVYPKPETLSIIQDKSKQKKFYTENNLPTSKFKFYTNINELKKHINDGKIDFPCVWKKTKFGYDGYGVKIIRSNQDLENISEDACMAEDLVSIDKELGIIVCRSPKGEIQIYPCVEMEFHPEANQVEYVLSPARISKATAKKAEDIALKVSKAFKHVGLLAVELFLTKEGEIWVNEVAPRPHNSGHYSIEASYTSQYEQHIRAIMDLPLGNTENKVAGVMVNLVGKEGYSGPVHYKNIEHILAIEGVKPHIYGKKETRPFRKMGHVTVVNKDLNIARKIAEEVKETIEVISK